MTVRHDLNICDNCGKTTENSQRTKGWIWIWDPEDRMAIWITLADAQPPDPPDVLMVTDGPLDFCCSSCLKEWVDKKSINEKP